MPKGEIVLDGHKMEGGEEIKVVVFDVGERQFGIRIDYVREILEHRDPTAVPDAPAWLAGILDVAGEVLPVISLHKRLDAERRDARRHLINLTTSDGDMVFTADEVNAIRVLRDDQIRPVEHFAEEKNDHFLEGAVSLEGKIILLIDPRKIVDMEVVERATEKAS